MVFLHWWREVERGFRRRRRIGSGKEMKRRGVRWWKSGGGAGEDCECREKRFSVEIVSWLFHFTLLNLGFKISQFDPSFRFSVAFNFDEYRSSPFEEKMAISISIHI